MAAPGPEETPLAAIDLGSNSFHMLVARPENGQLAVIDRLREMVRLAAGLGPDGDLDAAARDRALACLERFGQRLRGMPSGTVRVVGTNTLRKARNAGAFLDAAEAALGHPIEVIAGREEARLIYLGVAHSLPEPEGKRLVVDIGGGSTELILGDGFQPQRMDSLYMGCVSASRAHFPEGRLSREGWEAARLAARLELEPVAAVYRRGWASVVGASGTIKAVAQTAQAAGWCETGITRPALKQLRKALLKAEHVDDLDLPGLKDERRPVFPGGLAVLDALFEDLGLETMEVSDGALREGLLYDLMGRIAHEDVRERTIDGLAARFGVDREQAERVEATAYSLYEKVAEPWGLDDEESANLLAWAARLHEIGLAVAYSQYHRHGAYLLANADLPGFSRPEQLRLAALVRAHRRKFPKAVFKDLPGEGKRDRRLAAPLRLAALLYRNRTDTPLPAIGVEAEGKRLNLRFPEGWLAEHPLTVADLEQEAGYLEAAGVELRFF